MSNELNAEQFFQDKKIRLIDPDDTYSRNEPEYYLIDSDAIQYAKLKTAQLEAEKAELANGLKDITRQFERVGRLYSLDRKAISAANAIIQKHAAK